MANSELFLRDSVTDTWRPLKETDLVSPAPAAAEQPTVLYRFVSSTNTTIVPNTSSGTLVGVNLTFTDAAEGDFINLLDLAGGMDQTIVKLVASNNNAIQVYQFLPSSAINHAGLRVDATLTGPASFEAQVFYTVDS